METIVKAQPIVPDAAVNRRSIDNLRQTRLDFEEIDLQVEELVSKFDELIRRFLSRGNRLNQLQSTAVCTFMIQ